MRFSSVEFTSTPVSTRISTSSTLPLAAAAISCLCSLATLMASALIARWSERLRCLTAGCFFLLTLRLPILLLYLFTDVERLNEPFPLNDAFTLMEPFLFSDGVLLTEAFLWIDPVLVTAPPFLLTELFLLTGLFLCTGKLSLTEGFRRMLRLTDGFLQMAPELHRCTGTPAAGFATAFL